MSDTNLVQDDRYPFGVLTVPWYLAGGFLAIWTFGPLYVYHFSFVAANQGWGKGTVGVQDFAGYVGFGFVGIFTIIAAVVLSIVHRNTFKLPMPNPRDVLVPAVVSTLVFALPYVAVSVFYEKHRYDLPYDGNWASITGICSVGFAHFVVLNALAKRSQQTAQPDREDAAG